MTDAVVFLALLAALDPVAARTRAGLERQAFELSALLSRIRDAGLIAPAAADGDWRSPAQRAYDAALRDVRLALTSAELSVGDALAETRRAIASMSSRAG